MRAFISVRSLSCLLGFALVAPAAVAAAAESTPASVGALAGPKSSDARQLAADLKFLQGQRAALDQKRLVLEAELAKVQASGDIKRTAELPASVEMMRRKVATVDKMILATNDRLKTLEAPDASSSGSKAGPAQPTKKKATGTKPASQPISAAAKQKIKTAARQLAQKPNPSLTATRSAASALIAANPLDFSGMPIEDAMVYLAMIMAQDARKDLKDSLFEMDRKRKDKKAQRDTANQGTGTKTGPDTNEMSGADQRQIAAMQDRKSQFEQLLSEALKKSSDPSGEIAENMK